MKCPILINAYGKYLPEVALEKGNCLRKECGLFDQNGNRCSILEISRLLQAAGSTLGTIAKELTMLRPK